MVRHPHLPRTENRGTENSCPRDPCPQNMVMRDGIPCELKRMSPPTDPFFFWRLRVGDWERCRRSCTVGPLAPSTDPRRCPGVGRVRTHGDTHPPDLCPWRDANLSPGFFLGTMALLQKEAFSSPTRTCLSETHVTRTVREHGGSELEVNRFCKNAIRTGAPL